MKNPQTFKRGASPLLAAPYSWVEVSHPGRDGRGPDVIYKQIAEEIMIQTVKTFKHETKCMNCGKGSMDHRGSDDACPIGTTKAHQFPFGDATTTFTDSGKPTLRSVRRLNKLIDQEKRIQDALQAEANEKAKVRAMTYEEVVTEVCEMLTEKTGLGIIVERTRPGQCEIHLTTLGGKIRLGYTSVTQYSNGSFGVAGTSAGCFMGNHSDSDIRNVLDADFKSIQEKANKEKV